MDKNQLQNIVTVLMVVIILVAGYRVIEHYDKIAALLGLH